MTILIALSAIADKIKLPYPVLLVIVGLVIGFTPFLPDLELDPDVVFLIFLPPLLYDAASKTSWLEFKREIRPISTLAVTLVFSTTILVGVATHYLVPGFTWPLAFVLGAIISPPDAVAATSITRGLGLSRKVITIIEGESLVNDASALIAYRYALAAAMSGTFVLWKAGLQFLFVSLGGIGAGLIVGYLFVFAHKKIRESPIVETSLTLLAPYVAYLVAEHIHCSGVLAVVCTGLFVSWRSHQVFASQARLQIKVVWETVIFLLNGIVFILIGLQLPAIVKGLKNTTIFELVGYGLLISLVTIVIRIIWVFAGAYNPGLDKGGKGKPDENGEPTSWKNVLIVAWTGTRGVVSLATALALPLFTQDGDLFPKRHSIQLLAFVVILVTLVVQGLTLPLLIRLLKINPQASLLKQEENQLQLTIAENVLNFINNNFTLDLEEQVKLQVRKPYELSLSLLSAKGNGNHDKRQTNKQINYITQLINAQIEIVNYQRDLLNGYHKDGSFGDETLRKAEEELDIEEMRLKAIAEKRKID